MNSDGGFDESVLILAEQRRKAEVLCRVGTEAGFVCRTVESMAQFCGAISRTEAAVGIVTEEVLRGVQLQQLVETLQQQPNWSDFPLLIVARPGTLSLRSSDAVQDLARLRNATILERPLRLAMLVNALFVALRARRGQYLLRAAEENAALLRNLQSTQQQLAQAHRRTFDILESIQDIFFSLDADWRFTYINKWAEDAWGVKAETLIGVGFWKQFPHLVGSYAHEQALRSMHERQPVRFETFSVVQSKWLSVHVYPAADGGLSVYSRDCTVQRRLETELRESEERFRVLSQAALEGIMIHDNQNIVDANDRFASLFGYSTEDIQGLTVDDLVAPEARSEALQRALSGHAQPFQAVGLRRDGSRFPAEFVIRRIEFRGNPARVAIVRDLTKQKEAERVVLMAAEAERIEQERARLEAILHSLNEGVVLLAVRGDVLYMNPSAIRLLGKHPAKTTAEERLALEESYELLTLDGRLLDKPEWPSYRVLNGEKLGGIELRLRRKDTPLQWIGSFSGTPVLDADGRLLFVLISFRDVTAEHFAAKELQNVNASLRELSGQLLKSQDDERKRIARELHDGAVQLITAISLNFMSIRQSIQPASDELPDLLSETEHLIKLAHRDLRTLSFLLHPPDLQEAGLAVALRSWANGFSTRTPVEVQVEILDPGRLHPDIETALFRIAQESLANVQRHSGSETAILRLFTRGDLIVLEVQDAGQGFSSEVLQPQGPSVRMGVGVLGMRERARQLGGTLQIVCNDGGTTVRVALPKGASQ